MTTRMWQIMLPFAGTLALMLCAPAGQAQEMPFYAEGWAVIHHDNRNSDHSPEAIADTYVPVWQTSRMQYPFNKPVIGADNTIYYTYRGPNYDAYLVGMDGQNGAQKFLLGPPTVNQNISAGNVLASRAGDVFISDNYYLMRITPSGGIVWRIPVKGVQPSGLQFLPDGNLLMMTWNGMAYVVNPADGAVLLQKNMTPGRRYPSQVPSQCLLDGDSPQCVYANTPAIDPYQWMIYQTFITKSGKAAVQAYQYQMSPRNITLVWSNSTLQGGSASSVSLSADYSRLYVSDRGDNLVALDAATGSALWTANVGFTANESVVVNPNGYLVPGGSLRDARSHLAIWRDLGSRAELVYENDDYAMISSVSAGANDYFVFFGRNKATGTVELLVVHPLKGIVGRSAWGKAGDKLPDSLGGVSIGQGGQIIVLGFGGGIGAKLFKPVWPSAQ